MCPRYTASLSHDQPLLQVRDVNETLRSETETFGFQFETRPRPYHFSRDRDVQFWVRDETETLIGRDRDIFRDLFTLSFRLYLKYFCLA